MEKEKVGFALPLKGYTHPTTNTIQTPFVVSLSNHERPFDKLRTSPLRLLKNVVAHPSLKNWAVVPDKSGNYRNKGCRPRPKSGRGEHTVINPLAFGLLYINFRSSHSFYRTLNSFNCLHQ